MASQPQWRQAVDRAERAVGPHLEQLVRTEQFAIAVGLVSRANTVVRQQTERASRRVLHLWNLPAGSDVTRIIAQLAELQRQVRDLSRRIEDQREAAANGRTAQTVRRAGPRPPRP